MRSILYKIILLLALASPSLQASVHVIQLPLKVATKTWLVENHQTPVVVVKIAFRGGNVYAPHGKEGLATLLTTMLNEGAGPYDAHAYVRLQQEHNFEIGVDADDDYVVITCRFLKDNAEQAWALLNATLQAPHLTQASFQRMKQGMLNRVLIQEKDPNYQLSKALASLIFKDHPYGRELSGSPASVRAWTLQDLKEFTKNTLTRQNVMVSVCGDITPAEATKRLESLLGPLPEKSTFATPPHAGLPTTAQHMHVTQEQPQTLILLAQKGLAPGTRDFVKLSLFDQIFGAPILSRLHTEVREKRGLAYVLLTAPQVKQYAQLYITTLGTKNDKAQEALDLIKQLWKNIRQSGITAKELTRAKQMILGHYFHNFTSSATVADLMLSYEKQNMPPSYMTERVALIQSITLDEMNAFIKNFLTPEALQIATLGPLTLKDIK